MEASEKRSSISYHKDEKGKLADNLVTSGLSLEAIAKVVGWRDRRWTYDHYRRRKLLGLYHKSKPGYLNYVALLIRGVNNKIEQELSTIVQTVQIQDYSKASNVEKKAFEKTFEFFQFTPLSKYTWRTLGEVLSRHFAALEKGEKKSTCELCYGFDISPMGLVGVRKKLHLEPLYGSRRSVTREEQEVIKRAFYINMSIPDIAYFIPPLKHGTVLLHMSKIGRRPRAKIQYLGIVRSHRLASQIYGAIDLGFTIDETAGLYDTKRRVVEYAINHRQTIEPKIIDLLRVIYPDRKINKPYLEELL